MIRETKLREEIIDIIINQGRKLSRMAENRYKSVNWLMNSIIEDVCKEYGYKKPKIIRTIMELNHIEDERKKPKPKQNPAVKKIPKIHSSKWKKMNIGDIVDAGEYSRRAMQMNCNSFRLWGNKQNPIRRFTIKKTDNNRMVVKRIE